jgi:RNA polymerase subunit RPABC4/transcription elongation factor Spt4
MEGQFQFCPSCGKQIVEGDVYCPGCGRRLENNGPLDTNLEGEGYYLPSEQTLVKPKPLPPKVPPGPRFVPVGGSHFFKPRSMQVAKSPPKAPPKPQGDPKPHKPIPEPASVLDNEALKAKAKLKKLLTPPPPKDKPRVRLCKICGEILPEKGDRCPKCGSTKK